MEKVTAKQVEQEIDEHKKEWLNDRDKLYPEFKYDNIAYEINFLCSRWFSSKVQACLPEEKAYKVFEPFSLNLSEEMIRFKGCSMGMAKLAIKVTTDCWNAYVEENQ